MQLTLLYPLSHQCQYLFQSAFWQFGKLTRQFFNIRSITEFEKDAEQHLPRRFGHATDHGLLIMR